MSPYNLKDSQLFLIKEDDYECDDTRLPPNVYQFFCKRGYGYLSIKKSEVEDKKSAVQVEIVKERGINIDKFRKIIGSSGGITHRIGYICNNEEKTEYYLVAKYINGAEYRSFDKNISKEIQLWFVKRDIFEDKEKLKAGKYTPLTYKHESDFFFFSADAILTSDNQKDEDKANAEWIVSIISDKKMILEYTSNTEDNLCIYQESKFLFQRQPDQPDQSTPSYHIPKNPNIKA